MPKQNAFITKMVKIFLQSRLSIIFIVISLLLGLSALILMPKEEDPQIIVPMADIMLSAPGTSAQEMANLVTLPAEKLLWQVDNVEDVYAVSKDNTAIVTVKFHVGTDEEKALVNLNTKLNMNQDKIPSLVRSWLVKPVTINDVPILNIVLYSKNQDDFALRRVGEELLTQLSQLQNISNTTLTGGLPLSTRVILNNDKLNAFHISPLQVFNAIQDADSPHQVGYLDDNNQHFSIQTHPAIHSIDQLKSLTISSNQNRPIYLSNIATIKYGPEEYNSYSHFGFSKFAKQFKQFPDSYSAVTLSIAKKAGTNAIQVSQTILKQLNILKEKIIPSDVHLAITRDYGKTANDKVNDLLYSLGLAIATVVIILIFSLGWRESLIVATSVPVSFALALFVDYLLGYTVNRVTLFALILSLGLLVDDPITNVENIQRHIKMKYKNTTDAIINAVNEVLPPVIMASLTIIVSFLPLFFITGMMGPYMSPMAATVPLTIIFSTIAALTIVPWMSQKLLAHHATREHKETVSGKIKTGYQALVLPFLESQRKRYILLFGIIVSLLLCGVLVLLQAVPLQLLPFDNKNELQLVINLPEGSTLEQTNRVTDEFTQYLKTVPYVKSYTTYVGTPSPMDFNGMVRHYYLRQAANLADIRINLFDKSERSLQSHETGLLMRHALEKIAQENHVRMSLVELPPGPPVLAKIVAEVTGDNSISYDTLIKNAQKVEALLAQQKNVVDVSDSTETPHKKIEFTINRKKSALNNISTQQINQTLALALGQTTPMTLHKPDERQPLNIQIMLPRAERNNLTTLSSLPLINNKGAHIPLRTLGQFHLSNSNQPIYQKNLKRVVFVYANTAGEPPASVILSMSNQLKAINLPNNIHVNWSGEGEWKITIRVFRDMGIGFLAAMIAIYILLLIQTNSFLMPLIMMIAIPLTIIGIIPGFWLLNLIANHTVGGYPTPIFFTATSMIGMIALGGIVIRNSLILVDFIDKSREAGVPFKEAVLNSGAVRLRPIVLTALAAALGAWPITLDPIFSGLAWALIFGLLASTTFTLLVIPVTYYALYYKRYE